MSYKDFYDDIKADSVKNLYLFYGEEEYIKNQALIKLDEYIVENSLRDFNYQMIDGSELAADDIVNACETLPFMGSRRLVVVKDYFLLKTGGRKVGNEQSELDKLSVYLDHLPETTYLIFYNRGEIDNRKKLVNLIKKYGKLVEFQLLNDRELIKWVNSTLKQYHKQIGGADIEYMLFYTGRKLEDIHNEILKLIDYMGEKNVIGRDDIDKIVTKTLEHNIFEMVDKLAAKKIDEGIIMLHRMMADGESCLGLLAMIARQFRIILQTKSLSQKGYSNGMISKKLKVPPFVIAKSFSQGKNFTKEQLKSILQICFETDYHIKTGKLREQLAIEMLVFKIVHP